MKPKARLSLKQYAAEHQGFHGGKCWVCTIPERAEIDEALRSGIGTTRIMRWLVHERGYKLRERVGQQDVWRGEASGGRVNSHWQRCIKGAK